MSLNLRAFGLTLSTCVWMLVPPVATYAQPLAQCTQDATLSDVDRRAFISAAFGADAMVWVELLSAASCEETVARAVVGLDAQAQVHYRDDKVGYLLVRIARPKLLDVLDLRGLDSASIPALVVMPTRPRRWRPAIAVIAVVSVIRVIGQSRASLRSCCRSRAWPRRCPADGPYFPAAEAGLTELWSAHPEADGRGVRIAAVDDGFDLLHPAMLQARDKDGAIVPKVAALDATTLPAIDDNWVRFGAPIQSTNGVLRAAGRDWRVPADDASRSDAYRFGVYRHTVTLGFEADAKTHPIPKAALSAGVLWHEPTGRVWFDTDGDGDFRNERTLTDYSRQHDIAWFGSRDEDGSADHRIPFGIKIDPDRQAVYVSIGGVHGAFIGGAIAANRMTGGLFDGAAPAAQLIDVRSGVTLIPSILRALAREDADVVNRSGLDRDGSRRRNVRQACVRTRADGVSEAAGVLLQPAERAPRERLSERGHAAPQSTASASARRCDEQRGVVQYRRPEQRRARALHVAARIVAIRAARRRVGRSAASHDQRPSEPASSRRLHHRRQQLPHHRVRQRRRRGSDRSRAREGSPVRLRSPDARDLHQRQTSAGISGGASGPWAHRRGGRLAAAREDGGGGRSGACHAHLLHGRARSKRRSLRGVRQPVSHRLPRGPCERRRDASSAISGSRVAEDMPGLADIVWACARTMGRIGCWTSVSH